MDEYLICDGCSKPIFVGDEVLEIKLCECEDAESRLIHKRIECLLLLDGVTEETIVDIRTISPEELRESSKGLKLIK